MDSKDKKQLSETDICDLFITPAIKQAGWDQMQQMRREVTLTPGPVVVRGNMSSRNKKKRKFADYVLSWEPGIPVAVVEAKDNNYTVSHGLQQGLGYAEILNVPSAFSSNGDAFASHNKVPAPGQPIETEFPLDQFPGPQTLWARYKQWRGIDDSAEPLVTQPYYQDISARSPAITRPRPLTAPSRPLPRDKSACCWSWPPAPARPTPPSRSSGACGRRAGSSGCCSSPTATSWWIRPWSTTSSPSARS